MTKEYQTGYQAYQAGDFRRAQSSWQLAAQENDPHAQYALGLMYFRGDLGKPEYELAARWFQKAAMANHGGAIYYLGLMHFNGFGVPYDHFQATKYFKRALRINPNNGNAAYIIGSQYFHGRGARQNFVEAAHYFEIAAKQNMRAGQFMYGALLERGWGVKQSYADAYYWLRRAASGTITFPIGAGEDEPLDPNAAIAELEPRLRPEEIARVEKRLAAERLL
ncbi:sel1 repeat family protein [Thalassospira sp. HF15]|nr:tetratricopeptide repeat protein [Thalassospira sp. HF15]NIY77250.1 sel1 repeat family protein [Thalassospira sp. HF15]